MATVGTRLPRPGRPARERISHPDPASRPGDGELALAVLAVLPIATVVVDATGTVIAANPAAVRLGVVDGTSLAVAELREAARACLASGTPMARDVLLAPRPQPPLRRARPGANAVAVKVALTPLSVQAVCLVCEDVTESQRVEAVRRDFVANVSHELKTPVGALGLLAEAITDAAQDPAAVARFAARMRHESGRLARLVQELIDLSRLQGADPQPVPHAVGADGVIGEALDRCRLAADAREIRLVTLGEPGLLLWGDDRQLVTAVANLVDNAVAYSPPNTEVTVGLRAVEDEVEISVKDEGIGIAPADRERIFERFYRADPARSRATGGTGLGLAIVKHIAGNHGGSVHVWSRPGAGSTFLLRLPGATPHTGTSAAPRTDIDDRPVGGAR